MRDIRVTLAVLAFGTVALVGLIVLAAISHLDDATRGVLQAVAFGALTGAAGITIPGQQAPPPATEPAAGRARPTG